MHIVTNTHKDPLGLPTGQVLAPNTPTPVHGWDEMRKNAVIAAWMRAGLLKEEQGAGDQSSQFMQPDKAELHAKLDALEVKYDKRSGVAKLQALLAEAEEAQAQKLALLEQAQAAAIEASGLTAEAWAELPEEEREAQLAAEVEKLQAPQD